MNPYKNLFPQNTIVKTINDMEDELVTYFKSLSRNILKDVYQMDSSDQYSSHSTNSNLFETFTSQDDIVLHLLKVLDTNNDIFICDTLSQIIKTKNLDLSTLSNNLIIDHLINLLDRFYNDICVEILKIFIKLLENEIIDNSFIITSRMVNIFNKILDDNNEKLVLLVLKCFGLVIYQIAFIERSVEKISTDLKELCNRLKKICQNRYTCLEYILSTFNENTIYLKTIGQNKSLYIVECFTSFKLNRIRCLEYFNLILQNNCNFEDSVVLCRIILRYIYSLNTSIMIMSSRIFCNTLIVNNRLRQWLKDYGFYLKLVLNMLENKEDNLLLYFFLSAIEGWKEKASDDTSNEDFFGDLIAICRVIGYMKKSENHKLIITFVKYLVILLRSKDETERDSLYEDYRSPSFVNKLQELFIKCSEEDKHVINLFLTG
jgi:hypothetical protein